MNLRKGRAVERVGICGGQGRGAGGGGGGGGAVGEGKGGGGGGFEPSLAALSGADEQASGGGASLSSERQSASPAAGAAPPKPQVFSLFLILHPWSLSLACKDLVKPYFFSSEHCGEYQDLGWGQCGSYDPANSRHGEQNLLTIKTLLSCCCLPSLIFVSRHFFN